MDYLCDKLFNVYLSSPWGQSFNTESLHLGHTEYSFSQHELNDEYMVKECQQSIMYWEFVFMNLRFVYVYKSVYKEYLAVSFL